MAKVMLILADAEHEGCPGLTVEQEWDPPLIATKDGTPLQPTLAQQAAFAFLKVLKEESGEVITLEEVSIPINMVVPKRNKGRYNEH